MFMRRTGDSWHWSMHYDMSVDFCVWVLRMDGLRAFPFMQHPEGNHVLQDAGLTPQVWQVWFLNVLNNHQKMVTLPDIEENIQLGNVTLNPLALWEGDKALLGPLQVLFDEYCEQVSKARADEPLYQKSRKEPDLWKELRQYKPYLPTLHVYVVRYPQEVLWLYPPVAMVLGNGEGKLTSQTYAAYIREGARQLQEIAIRRNVAISS